MPPAARITDLHTCPKPAHVGGPITSGAATVLIGHKPAARVSDTAICVPATDSIAAGAFNVIVENHPAARIGDPTVHGAVIVTGCPTVIIGTTPQSFALTGAAGNGTPICEECERARREAEAQAARERAALSGTEEPEREEPPPAAPAPAEEEASADTPSEDEAEQAAAPGNTTEQRVARERVVRSFYADSGLGSARADVDLGVGGMPPRPNLHVKGFGIDISQPLRVVPLPETLTQVLAVGAAPGNVFAAAAGPLASAVAASPLANAVAAAAPVANAVAAVAPLASAVEASPLASAVAGARPVTFTIPAGQGLVSISGPGAGRTPGAPQVTVPDSILRFAACICCGQAKCGR